MNEKHKSKYKSKTQIRCIINVSSIDLEIPRLKFIDDSFEAAVWHQLVDTYGVAGDRGGVFALQPLCNDFALECVALGVHHWVGHYLQLLRWRCGQSKLIAKCKDMVRCR